ncbi:MAG: hypothetical protein AB8B50_09940 [Pirellulaceae bacterium]
MRSLLALCLSLLTTGMPLMAQQTNPSNLRTPRNSELAPQVERQAVPQSSKPQSNRAAQPAPGTKLNLNDLNSGGASVPPSPAPPVNLNDSGPQPLNLNDVDPLPLDDLNLDSAQSFDFEDSDDFQFTSTSNSGLQSSVASNSSFRGASPQMIGDFGGGSTIFRVGGDGDYNYLSATIPFAGGSRRIKIAENNQVRPMDRVYGTFNYFHNSSRVIGAGQDLFPGTAPSLSESESLFQYTFGVEKTFLDGYFSVDLRMPFTGGFDQTVVNDQVALGASALRVATGEVGNLSTTIKAYLLQAGRTSISGGLQVSIPTGSGVELDAEEAFNGTDAIDIDNNAVHLMPFIGAYRTIGDSWWLQAFAQVDTPANGNEVRTNGLFTGYINEQTLLYSDISLGKWLYRNPCNSRRCGGCGISGIASIIELHYTSSLNDADALAVSSDTQSAFIGGGPFPGYENRFDVLNLTLGLQTEISEVWRINTAFATPLREGRFDDEFGSRQEDQFFDGELSIQINRFF